MAAVCSVILRPGSEKPLLKLRRLDLSGFKSFVDPTTVTLPSNRCAVVGPNGCGKSNIIDAVRWVMGEGSAKVLRGESMADVIFSGSSTRKPVGTASVELVFDNSDGGAGGDAEVDRIHSLVDTLGIDDQVRFVAPQPHHLLSTYYRASDLVMAPSRSESFGLVALEAGACGTPVVAAAVGGLRTLIDHGNTGFLVEGRDPAVYAAYANEILDNPLLAAEMAMNAAEHARSYTWMAMAQRLGATYGRLRDRQLVSCA